MPGIKEIWLLFLLPVLWVQGSMAQQAQADELLKAEKLFRNGSLPKVIEVLEPMVQAGLDKELRFDAYHLLALAYEAIANENKSRQYIELMLRERPEYLQFPDLDPQGFLKLLNSYSVRPLFYLGSYTGLNYEWEKIVQSYTVFAGKNIYTPSMGYHFGIFGEYCFAKNVSLRMDILVHQQKILQEIQWQSYSAWQQNITEIQSYLFLLPSLRFHKNISNHLMAELGLGFGLNRMTTADLEVQINNEAADVNYLATKNVLPERNRNLLTGTVHLGLQYNLAIGYLTAEMSYWNFFTETVNEDMRMNDKSFMIGNQYISDALLLRNLNFSVGYKLPVFYKIERK